MAHSDSDAPARDLLQSDRPAADLAVPDLVTVLDMSIHDLHPLPDFNAQDMAVPDLTIPDLVGPDLTSCKADMTFPGKCADTCIIDCKAYKVGERNPLNMCQECQPDISRNQWSPTFGALDCGPTGYSLFGVCSLGKCVGTKDPFADECHAPLIGGPFHHEHSGTMAPFNPCQGCWGYDGNDDTIWQSVADGTRCGIGCSVCQAGWCSCLPTVCIIAKQTYKAGVPNPNHECQYCDPLVSTTSWSSAPDLSYCSAGYCKNATCIAGKYPGPSYCTLFNAYPANAGMTDPSNPCRWCDPSKDKTTWSPKPDGTLCPDCVHKCKNGTCQ